MSGRIRIACPEQPVLVPQERYARLWMSLVRGTVPSGTVSVLCWYRAAQHVIGPLLHDAQLERILEDGDGRPMWDETQTAA